MPGHDAREEALSTRPTTIERVAATASTNDDLLARVRAAAAAGAISFAPCLLVADRQSAGRGRHGRAWHAAPGRSLTFSLAWQPARGDLAGLSLAVGAVLADTLEPPRETMRIGLKWPNDLWLVDTDADLPLRPGRKLAGILVETAPLGAQRVAVIGIGINVNAQAVAGAASGIASLDEIDPGATPSSTLARVAPALAVALERFDALGFAAFADRFAARDLLRGRAVAGASGGVSGVAAGVSDDGALLVDTGAEVIAVTSGEWQLRLGEPAEPSC
ncbi:MAG TPA: biotin--[acetyl-CoA-carboxylase] ligase [Caldimonas sp.]|jgi:BirA family biotin operon repressor/biotin-[acetyl-CoA-carboxylase] ligase